MDGLLARYPVKPQIFRAPFEVGMRSEAELGDGMRRMKVVMDPLRPCVDGMRRMKVVMNPLRPCL